MSSSISPDAVFNQPPPLENYNLFDSDCALKEAVARNDGGWIDADAQKFGELLGKPETINLGVFANRFPPELQTHDRFGYSLWEGAGNVQCFDVLRAMHKDPSTLDALRQEIGSATGFNSSFDRFSRTLISEKQMKADAEFGARWFVEKLALALQAAAIILSGNQGIADIFCAARLTESPGLVLGTLRSSDGVALLLERAQPKLQRG
jgi:hypothetical protein